MPREMGRKGSGSSTPVRSSIASTAPARPAAPRGSRSSCAALRLAGKTA